MALAKISPAQAATINLARQHAGDSDRKAIKKEVFATIKAAFGIPADTKLKVETTDAAHPDYLVLKDKSNQAFELFPATGRWVNAPSAQVEAKRWFFVDQNDLRNVLVEEVLSGTDDFDDGLATHQLPDAVAENLPAGATVVISVLAGQVDGCGLGGVYVLIAESEF